MLPYWHGAAIDFCVRPPAASTAAVDALSCESADTDADWYWQEEDRLQRTPSEQRMLEEQVIEEQTVRVAHMTALELSTFPTWCDLLSSDTRDCRRSDYTESAAFQQDQLHVQPQKSSTARAAAATVSDVVTHKAMWRADFSMGDCLHSAPPAPPMPPARSTCGRSLDNDDDDDNSADGDYNEDAVADSDPVSADARAGAQTNNSNANNSGGGGGGGQAVASGRSLAEIEAAVEHTRNNSNQQQRYEMRGGHAVEICSRVDFPDRTTRDVSVTVEATHSNGCHRVIMLKGLTAKKRPDLGPKVKDCRLRMDQIVMTRPSTSTEDWTKCITMSYDSDFQVGLGEERNQAL